MKSRAVFAAVTIAIVAFLLGQGFAQDDKPGMGMGMPAWMGTTAEHAKLKETVGEWEVDAQMWMAPGAPPKAFKGKAVRTSILNGKYIREKFTSTFMGRPFEGMLILGFDTIKKEYVSVWVDTMSPVPAISRGTEKDGVLVLVGMEPGMAGKMVKNRTTVEFKGDDEAILTNYHIADDGTEAIQMKMVYKRKK